MATALHSASGCTRFDALPGLIARLDRIAGRWQPYRRRSRELGALFTLGEREPRSLGLSHSARTAALSRSAWCPPNLCRPAPGEPTGDRRMATGKSVPASTLRDATPIRRTSRHA